MAPAPKGKCLLLITKGVNVSQKYIRMQCNGGGHTCMHTQVSVQYQYVNMSLMLLVLEINKYSV